MNKNKKTQKEKRISEAATRFTKQQLVNKYAKPSFGARLKYLFSSIKEGIERFRHPMIDEKNVYPLVYIWGNNPKGNLFSQDDICIIYNTKEEMFYLEIETAYAMSDLATWANYLKYTLKEFTTFMVNNGLAIDSPKELFMESPSIVFHNESIEALYTDFRLFTLAFCASCGLNLEDEEYLPQGMTFQNPLDEGYDDEDDII